MNWLQKVADSDQLRIERNITRLEDLKIKVHELGYFAVASQSGGFQALVELLDDRLVKGRELVHEKLKSALIGENNSKIALDAPTRFQGILVEAESLISSEIVKEKRKLSEFSSEKDGKPNKLKR